MRKGLPILLLFVFISCHTTPSGGSGNNSDGGDNGKGSELVHKEFLPSDAEILNPERGFFDYVEIDEVSDLYNVREKGFTLAYFEICLKGYTNTTIPDALLNEIRRAFEIARESGIKLILRVNYSDSSSDPVTDAPLLQILAHISQLSPLLQDYSDIILAMQAGFIGRWGEWHSSTNGLDNQSARKQVLDALLNALPPSRMIQVRRPVFKTEYLGSEEPLSESGAFGGSAASRIGHHNDCFLASDTDEGTYPSSAIEYWKEYIAKDGLFVPVGGETCGLNKPRSACENAMSEMARLHWSYLNSEYHEDVIQDWEEGGCLDEIRKHLGYRFVLKEAWWSKDPHPGDTISFGFKVSNLGYAALFNERDLYMVLDGPTLRVYPLDADPRRWTPNDSSVDSYHEVDEKILISDDMPTGTYKIGIWLPDASPSLRQDPRYAIRFANEGLEWDDARGFNIIGELELLP